MNAQNFGKDILNNVSAGTMAADIMEFSTFSINELMHVFDALEMARGVLVEASNRPGLKSVVDDGTSCDYVQMISDELAIKRDALVQHLQTRHIETDKDRDAFWSVMAHYSAMCGYDRDEVAAMIERVS